MADTAPIADGLTTNPQQSQNFNIDAVEQASHGAPAATPAAPAPTPQPSPTPPAPVTPPATSSGGSQDMLAYLQSKGYSKAGAAGILGNGWQENGLRAGGMGGDNGTSGGMFQWHADRATAFLNYVQSTGKPLDDWRTHLDYMSQEMGAKFPGLDQEMRSTTDPSMAAASFMHTFESPAAATANLANRTQGALSIFNGQPLHIAPNDGSEYGAFTNPRLQSERQAAANAPSGPGFISQALEAQRQNGLASNIFRDATYATIPEQEGYTATPAMVKADPRLGSIDPNEAASLEEARSPAEYEKRISDLQDDVAYQTRVSQSGVKGWLATQVGTLLDPAQLALGAVTGGESLIGKVLTQAAIGGASALYDQRRASELNYLSIGGAAALGAVGGAGLHLASNGIHPTLKAHIADAQEAAGNYAKVVQAKLLGKSEQEAMESGNARSKVMANSAAPVINGEAAGPAVTNLEHGDYRMMAMAQARKLDPETFDAADALTDKIDWAKANPPPEGPYYHASPYETPSFNPADSSRTIKATWFSDNAETAKMSQERGVKSLHSADLDTSNVFDFEKPQHVEKLGLPPDVASRVSEGSHSVMERGDVQAAIHDAGFAGYTEREGSNPGKTVAVYDRAAIKSVSRIHDIEGMAAQRDKLQPKIEAALKTVTDNLKHANIHPAGVGDGIGGIVHDLGAAGPRWPAAAAGARDTLHDTTPSWLSAQVDQALARRTNTTDKLGQIANLRSTGYLLRDDSNPAVRALGHIGVVNYGASGDGAPLAGEVATETKRNLVKTTLADNDSHADAKYLLWDKEQKAQGVPGKLRTRDAFSKQVSDAREERDPISKARNFSQHVIADADNKGKIYDLFNAHLNDPSLGDGQIFDPVKGATPPDKFYNPHQYDFDGINQFEKAFGTEQTKNFIADAVRRGPLRGVLKDPAALEAVAKGFARKLLSAREAMALGGSNILEDSDLKALPGLLRSAGVEGPEIDKVMGMFSMMKSEGDGEISRLKAKTPLLTSHSALLTDASGNKVPVKFTELMQRNADQLMHQYVGAVSGQIAWKRARFEDPNTGKLLIDGLDEQSKRDAYMKTIHDIDASNEVPMAETKAKINRVQAVFDHVDGRMHEADKGDVAAGARVLRNAAMSVYMGKTGIMHISQFARAMTEQGGKAFVSAMPILFKTGRSDIDGKLRSELAQVAQEMTGAGGDHWIIGKMATKPTDEHGNPLTSSMQTAERWSGQAARTMSALSLMAPVLSTLHRMATIGAISHFAQLATGERTASLNLLRQLGMDLPMSNRIDKMMQQYAGFQPGAKVKWGLDARMTRLQVNQWSDRQAARAFAVAVDRWGNRIANVHDIGQMNAFLGTQVGKMMGQFRSFTMGAQSNYLGNAINNPNLTTAKTVLAGSGLAYLGYWARQQASTAGMSSEDRQKALYDPKEGTLTAGKMFAGMVHGSGYASFLPTIADAALQMSDHHAFFDVRSTGISQTSAPALDLLTSAQRAVKGVAHAARTGEYSQSDAKALLRTMPFASSWAGTAVSNMALSGMQKTDHIK